MTKDQYFKNLEEIITDPIFIGSSKKDRDQEIDNNMWRITLERNLARQISVNEFVEFLNRIIENRQDQVRASNEEHGMIFYLWFDWQASQLRFNLISNIHEQLPFRSGQNY